MNKRYSGSFVALLAVLLWNLFACPLRVSQAQEYVPDQPSVKERKMQTGWVDAVNKEEVVIDDMASPLSSVTLYDQKGFRRDVSSLSVGQYVAFKRGEDEIEIHLLEGKGERPKSSVRPVPGQKDSESSRAIRQVDGVWKN